MRKNFKKVREKNMKRILSISVIALAALFTVTGCSAKDEATANADVIEATSNVDSYTGETELYFTAHLEGKEIMMGTDGKISLKSEPFFADIDLSIFSSDGDGNEETTNSRMILNTNEDVNTVYLFHNDEWQKETVEAEDFRKAASQYDVMENAKLIMETSENIQPFGTEEYNGVSADKYEGTIQKEDMPELLEEIGSLSLVGTNIGARYFNDCDELPVTVWVNGDDVILGYEIDLTEVVQNLFDALYDENDITLEEYMIKFDSYIAKGTVLDYNEGIDTTIPDEAINANEVNSENN